MTMIATPENTTESSAATSATLLSPERAAARTIQQIERNNGENPTVSREAIAELLEIECRAVAEGDMTVVRRTLAAQIRVLERLYDHLLDRAMSMGAVAETYDRYLRLAFRAQAQLNRTIALLDRFNRQANAKPAQQPTASPQPVNESSAPTFCGTRERVTSTALGHSPCPDSPALSAS